MKRFAIVLLAVATALVMALPATAKKPVRPEPVPLEYDVEIVIVVVDDDGIVVVDDDGILVVGDDGIATADPCGGSARVVRDGANFQSWDGAELYVSAPGLEWDRTTIAGCHGRGLTESFDISGDLIDSSVTEQPAPGYFRITLDNDGSIAMLWIFDVYQSEQIVKELKKRTLWDITERTDFRMGGPYDSEEFALWGHSEDDLTGVITTDGTGTFCFVRYERGGDPVFTELEDWCQEFSLQITLTPIS